MTLILFTTTAPHPLADELAHQGIRVFEAVAISEVYALADQHLNATIIITADVDPERARAVQYHYTTLHLKPGATVQDIVWEVSNLNDASVQ